MRLPVVVGLATLAACSGKKSAEPETQPAEVGQVVHSDGGTTAVVTDVDPTERHLDEDPADRGGHSAHEPSRAARPIDITLRSTPPGAQVAVDGTVLGTTPAYWSGMADGKEHEFVFTMRGYAIARYRFVPIASGVIHGRLDRIHEESDAGVPAPPPEVVPVRPPSQPSVNPPSAPPTIVNPAPVPDASPPGAVAPETVAPGSAAPSPGAAPIGPQP